MLYLEQRHVTALAHLREHRTGERTRRREQTQLLALAPDDLVHALVLLALILHGAVSRSRSKRSTSSSSSTTSTSTSTSSSSSSSSSTGSSTEGRPWCYTSWECPGATRSDRYSELFRTRCSSGEAASGARAPCACNGSSDRHGQGGKCSAWPAFGMRAAQHGTWCNVAPACPAAQRSAADASLFSAPCVQCRCRGGARAGDTCARWGGAGAEWCWLADAKGCPHAHSVKELPGQQWAPCAGAPVAAAAGTSGATACRCIGAQGEAGSTCGVWPTAHSGGDALGARKWCWTRAWCPLARLARKYGMVGRAWRFCSSAKQTVDLGA